MTPRGVLTLLLVLFLTAWTANAASIGDRTPPRRPHWVIVFDAGSTKTKMNLYELNMVAQTSKWIPLRTLSKKWSTALSRFNPFNSTDVTNIRSGFHQLFSFAETVITSAQDRRDTPVFLYATAGLRGLPVATAEALLAVSEGAINASSFDHSFPKSEMPRVRMITGTDEGRFAWLSVNYMLSPSIDNQTSKQDFGVIDMGGGSTQVALRPYNFEDVREAGIDPASLWYPGSVNNNSKTGPGVYSKSFADYGFSSTVMKYVGAYDDCRPQRKCPTGSSYSSGCLNPHFRSTFRFGPYEFPISGRSMEDSSERYRSCVETGKLIIDRYSIRPGHSMAPVRMLLSRDRSLFFGVSGYYFLAKTIAEHTNVTIPLADSGSGGKPRCHGYQMTVDRFRRGAQQLCTTLPMSEVPNPFLPYSCIQASYVVGLFTFGYRFPANAQFEMCDKLPATPSGSVENGIEIGWPLGVAQQAAEKVLEKHF